MLRQIKKATAVLPKTKPIITFLGDSTIDNRIWVDGIRKNYIYTRLSFSRSKVLRGISQFSRYLFRKKLSVIENVIKMMPDHEIHDFTNDGFTTEDCLSGAYRDKVFGRGTFSLFPHQFFQPLAAGKESLKASDVIVVSVGGNDVREFLQIIESRNSDAKVTFLKKQFPVVMKDLKINYIKLLDTLLQLNPNAKIILMSQYYPSVIQKNYRIYEKMSAIGAALNLGGESHHPMNVIHDIMKEAYKGILNHVVEKNISQVMVADVTSSLNPFDDNNHVCQIEPSAEGGNKIAKMLKYLITQNPALGNAYRFYPEFFAANDGDKKQFVEGHEFSDLSFAHPFDLREGYSIEEEKAYRHYGGDEYSVEQILQHLEDTVKHHDASSRMRHAGAEVLTEGKKLIATDCVKQLKLSLILAIKVLQQPEEKNIYLLKQNAKHRAIGKMAPSAARYKAALLILAGIALFCSAAATTSDTLLLRGGAVAGGLIIALGVGLFVRKRPSSVARTAETLAKVSQRNLRLLP
jgi:hypothetical protein